MKKNEEKLSTKACERYENLSDEKKRETLPICMSAI